MTIGLSPSAVIVPKNGSVLGIDIGYSETRRSSAVCRLDWNSNDAVLTVERFGISHQERSHVLSRAADRSILAAAFDGPLRADLQVIGRYRTAERLLTRQFQRLIGKPGQASSPVGRHLNFHANACARIVLDIGVVGNSTHDHAIHKSAIVEGFPTSFLGLLIENPLNLSTKRRRRSDDFYVHLVESRGLLELLRYVLPGRRSDTKLFETVTHHDERAAIICALTALCIVANDYTAVGDDDGWIVLPPASLIRSWGWKRLLANAQHGGLEWRGSSPIPGFQVSESIAG